MCNHIVQKLLYSRDHKGVGVAHGIISPKNIAQTSFQIDPKCFQQVAMEFYK